MDTQHISPRMLEAGIEALHDFGFGLRDSKAAEIVEAIYLAMRAKLVESRGGE